MGMRCKKARVGSIQASVGAFVTNLGKSAPTICELLLLVGFGPPGQEQRQAALKLLKQCWRCADQLSCCARLG
eukprot:7194085-Alexandrium_andersonii.AAC.1